MIEGLLRAVERLPVGARRGLMVALLLLLLAAVVTAFALAPTGAGVSSRPAGSSARLLPPFPTTATRAAGRPPRAGIENARRPAARTGPSQRARQHPSAIHRRPARGPVSEQPPPPPPRSTEGTMLAVARWFAVAYMYYQVGRLPGWARTAINATCTPAFARDLLDQPAQLTPLQAAHHKGIETYRVASVEPAGAPDTVVVSYVSEQDSADTGEFVLKLASEHGHWLVARLEA